MQRENFFGAGKNSGFITAKEVYILIGNESAASITERSKIVRLDQSSTSRRSDAARTKFRTDIQFTATKYLIENRKITCLTRTFHDPELSSGWVVRANLIRQM